MVTSRRGAGPKRGTTLPALVSTAALASSAASAFVLSQQSMGAAIGVSTGLAALSAWCSAAMRHSDRYRVMTHSGDVDLDAVASALPHEFELHRFAMTQEGGRPIRTAGYVTSHDVDRMIVLNPYKFEVVGRYQLPDAISPYADMLRDDRNGELQMRSAESRDREVVGLAGDLTSRILATGARIPLVVALRDDVRVTDDAFDRVIATTGLNGTVLFDGCSLSLDEDGSLLPISETGNVNEVDIHTLAITSDGCLAFMRGTRRHPIHPGKLVPTASVSLSPRDLGADRPIQEAMILALHDKLRQSYDLPEGVPMGSSTLGMARIIERNGAPEFYAITRIGATMAQLAEAARDVTVEPVADLARPWLASAKDDYDISDLLSRTAYTVLDSVVADMGISMAALLGALFAAMGDERMRVRVMQRLGLRSREAGYAGSATGQFGGR